MTHYYNDSDPRAAAWLRELIGAGHIPAGDVDERSIRDVTAADVAGYTQVHFFAGIGGWALALSLAGWPLDRRVWTGSCPCPPFSSAAKKFCKCGRRFGFYGVDRFGCERCGTNDERHLWPEFRRIIADGLPPEIVGEQVASADGREWLTRVRADLEALGYAVGAADLCAAGVSAPHIRQRLFWVADAGHDVLARAGQGRGLEAPKRRESSIDVEPDGLDGRLVLPAVGARLEGYAGHGDDGREPGRVGAVPDGPASEAGAARGVADTGGAGVRDCGRGSDVGATGRAEGAGPEWQRLRNDAGDADRRGGFWSAFDLIPCRDGKARRVEPGTFPLASGVPGRVGLLRGYGNAIVPQVGALFVAAYLETGRAVA